MYDAQVNTPAHVLIATLRIASALLGGAVLLLTAQAQIPLPLNPLVGTPYSATIRFNTALESTLIGVQSGLVTSGLNEVAASIPQANGGSFTIDLNPDPYARFYTTQYALVTEHVGGWITVRIEFPNMSALAFTNISNFYHDSRWGYSGLSVGNPENTLEFVYAGNFYSPYGFSYQDWWDFDTRLNPAAGPDQNPGPGNVAVPEPAAYGLLGSLALMGLGVVRKRRKN